MHVLNRGLVPSLQLAKAVHIQSANFKDLPFPLPLSTIMDTQININTIPSSPSSPDWDVPSTTVWTSKRTPSIAFKSSKTTTELGAAIKAVALKFRDMMEHNPSLQDMHFFLSKWVNAESGKIQPMVLEWLAHFDAVPLAAGHGRLDLVEALLSYGFELTGEAVKYLLVKAKETGSFKNALEFTVEKGWDINAPVGGIASIRVPILA
ncbi:hypothetical protein DM02DRAFT_374085 [Periconia macrospinosa]|uniref:Uncharacterized protein n=1 Tax=Periconia macrospinosa TaxID=97972 RepID=A0A2V1DU86_9PLEO|nr:hypothetical protein DM02DRAFT_374085 [Periconia macrospinosa]